MNKLDFNNNGNIDYSEFIIAHMDSDKMLQEDKLKEIFNLFDIDQSGTITADELKKVLGAGGPKAGTNNDLDDNEWDRIIDEVDKDGNGEISFEEFKAMIYNLFNIKQEQDEEDNKDIN
jgi:Ca2+-binding EF-hand superfamily protein